MNEHFYAPDVRNSLGMLPGNSFGSDQGDPST